MGAAVGNPSKKGGPGPDINITPLVDVVLVLLIIFMVMTPQMDKNAAVELPKIEHPDKQKPKKDPLEVTIDKNGELTIEKKVYDLASLEAHLKTVHAETPDKDFVLRGDRDTEFSKIKELLNMVRNVGFPRTLFSVSSGDKKGADEEGAAPAEGGSAAPKQEQGAK